MESLFEEAKTLYNKHREYITYENLRHIGYASFEADEILKYLSLLRVSGELHTYFVRVFDEKSVVYRCYINETTESRAKEIIETRCELYNVMYTGIKIEKAGDFEKLWHMGNLL